MSQRAICVERRHRLDARTPTCTNIGGSVAHRRRRSATRRRFDRPDVTAGQQQPGLQGDGSVFARSTPTSHNIGGDVSVASTAVGNAFEEDTNALNAPIQTHQINASSVNANVNAHVTNVGGTVSVTSAAIGNNAQIVHYSIATSDWRIARAEGVERAQTHCKDSEVLRAPLSCTAIRSSSLAQGISGTGAGREEGQPKALPLLAGFSSLMASRLLRLQRQHVARLLQMRLVEHLAVERGDARADFRTPRLRVAHSSTSAAIGVNAALMTGTWSGWIASMPVKPSRCASARGAFQPGDIAEIGVQRFDRLDAGGLRGDQAQRTHDLVSEDEFAVALAVGGGAERGRQILRAPGHRDEARRRKAIVHAAIVTASGVSVATGITLIDAVRRRRACTSSALTCAVEHVQRSQARQAWARRSPRARPATTASISAR